MYERPEVTPKEALEFVEKFRKELPEIWKTRGRTYGTLENEHSRVCALGAAYVVGGVEHPYTDLIALDNTAYRIALHVNTMLGTVLDGNIRLVALNDGWEPNEAIYEYLDQKIAKFKERNSEEL